MKITSPAFADKLPVPQKFTCNGANVSPPFEFIDVPKETRSLTLIVDDLDSPNRWVHWLVYNIPGDATHMDEGELPKGAVEGVCNGGTTGYEGPCPKYFSGIHHYAFSLYALDTMLDVPATADAGVVREAMKGHILGSAALTGIAEGEMTTAASS